MTAHPPGDPTERIRLVRPHLSQSLRKVADLVLAEPSAVEQFSAAELARRAGTSQATVTRFCQAAGFDTYQDLLLQLAREHGRAGGDGPWGTGEIGSDISPDADLEHVVAVVSTADVRSIQETARRLDLSALDRAAQAVARARRVDVYGVGGSGAVAAETETRLFRIGCPVHAWTEVHGATTSAALLTGADVALAISHSGATREVYEPLELARRRGATTIAVTNDPGSPLARVADLRLTVADAPTSFREGAIASRHSYLLIIDCLYVRVAQLTYERASASMALTGHIAESHSVDAVQTRRARRARPLG